jgi:predicted component of type VI protein secretion system
VATGGLGLEKKWELTMRLGTLNRFCGSLSSVVGNGDRPQDEGYVTPYALYLKLRELLGDLLALHPAERLFDCEAYNHLDPLRAFKELNRKIREEIRVGRATEPLRVTFSGTPGLLRATLEPQHFEKPTGYYLGVKTRLDRTKLALYLVDNNKFKLMPRSMEQVDIYGIELKEENYPPLELPGESDLHFFRVSPTSNQRRWDQIKQDQAASLVWNNSQFDLSDAAFTLYMTLPSAATA